MKKAAAGNRSRNEEIVLYRETYYLGRKSDAIRVARQSVCPSSKINPPNNLKRAAQWSSTVEHIRFEPEEPFYSSF
jgi:hypothetical protein